MIIAAKGAAATAQTALPYQWVAVGTDLTNSQIYTSTSSLADSWTSQTTGFGTSTISGVATNIYSLYAACSYGGKIGTSPDGVTWTQRTSSFSTTDINGIAFGNGMWVAVGASNKIATSPDGITWTQRTSGGTTETWRSVHYGDGIWVILASNGSIRTATDPTGTWTSRTSTLTTGSYNGLHYDPVDDIWVAGAEAATTGALASSPDGITWTSRNATFARTVGLYCPMTSNSTVFVAGGYTGSSTADIESSTNGTTWTNRTPSDTTGGLYCAASDETGLLLFMGEDIANVETSTDGTTWTNRGLITSFFAYAVCHSSGVPSIR